ncbi:MAG TPA: DUF503 domain-containing protein [Chloroflexota bacterium]|nr:DUF503 domain-containing protein [Chloroflexota bacterium]
MILGTLSVRLRLRGNRSLKEKRRIVKRLVMRIHNRFNVTIAEVGDNDLHQSAILGVACVANDAAYVHSVLDRVLGTMVSMLPEAECSPETREIIHL